MFKHGDHRHETAAEARACHDGAKLGASAWMQEQHTDDYDFMGRVIGTPDEGRWSSADRERAQFMADRDHANVRAQANRDAYDRPAPVRVSRPGSRVTEDGMYRDPSSGRIWKVQFNRASGDGRRLYAKALVVDVEPSEGVKGEMHFTYATGAMREIRPEWRMSLEEAKAWGALYGTCVYGHPLTKESSIKRGMGDICWEKYGNKG